MTSQGNITLYTAKAPIERSLSMDPSLLMILASPQKLESVGIE